MSLFFLTNAQAATLMRPPNHFGLVGHWPLMSRDSAGGPNKITNGTFSSDTGWTKDTGVEISGGTMNFTAGDGANTSQPAGIETNKTYRTTYTISNYASGSIKLSIGGYNSTSNRSANGTYTEDITVTSSSNNGRVYVYNQSNDFVGSVDDLTVREINMTADKTSNANHGIIQGTIDARNHGYEFDGVDDSLGLNSFSVPTGPVSLSVWFKANNLNTAGILGKTRATYSSHGFGLTVHDSKLRGLYSQNNEEWHDNLYADITPGVWHHAVLTFDNGNGATSQSGVTGKLYMDGVLQTSHTGTTQWYGPYEFFAGASYHTGYASKESFFNGNIADIRVYDVELNASEVSNLYNNQDIGIPIGHWTLDRHTRDASGNGNHGVPLPDNKGPYYTTGPQSQANGAMVFDGSNDYVQTTSALLSGDNNFTFSGWVKLGDLTAIHRFFSQGSETANEHFWVGANSSTGYFQWGFWANDKTTTTALSADTWYHIAITKDGANSYGFVNGTQIDSLASGTVNIASNPAYLGAISDSHPHRMAGALADVRIYDRVLTAQEITDLSNGQNVATPVGHWKLDGNIQDSSSNGNHGIVDTDKFYDGPWPIGDASYFDGASSIDVDSSNVKPTGSQTFSVWYKADTHFPVDWMQIWGGQSFSSSADKGHAFGITRQDLGGAIVSDLHNGAPSGGKRSMGWINYPGEGWHLVTSVYDKDIPRHIVYVDGEKVIDKAMEHGEVWDPAYLDISWGSLPLRLGSNYAGTGWYYSGYLRDFRVYERALSASEASRLYTLQSSGTTESKVTPPSRSDLVGQWKLGEAASQGGSELHTNWDMESGVGNWTFDAKTDGTKEEYTTDKYAGSKSAKLTNSTIQPIAFWQQQTGQTVGDRYHVSVWAKDIDSPTAPYFAASGATRISGDSDFTGISTGEWKYYSAIYEATTSAVNIYIRTTENATQGSFLIDNFSLKKIVAADFSGQENGGNIYGNPIYSPGPHGDSNGAMNFDGTGDYISLSDSGLLSDSNFTLSAWFQTNSTAADKVIYAEGGNSSVLDSIGIDVGHIAYSYNGNSNMYETVDTFNDGQWHHLVLDRANNRIYIDGKRQTLQTGTMYRYSNKSLIGARELSSSFDQLWSGDLANIQLYDKTLSGAEISALYRHSKPARINTSQNDKVTSGLVGLWSFNGSDVNESTAYDRSGSGNNGTISGATPDVGKVGQGMYFDGNDMIYCGTDASYAFGSADHSFAAWVRPSALEASTTYNYIVSVGNNSNGQQSGFGIKNTASGANVFHSAYSSPLINFSTTHAIPLDEWSHVALVHSGGTSSLYVNGTHKQDLAIALNVQTGMCYIGTHTGGTSYFDEGVLDEIRIYDRALSASEITQLYNLGR